jgi:hypothetical protein
MPKVALARHINVRNHSDLRVIDIHDRKLRHVAFRPQLGIIKRPNRFVNRAIGKRLGVRVKVGHEGDEPVFHVRCNGGVVDIY